MLVPYPRVYQLIFGLIEPAGLVAGGVFALGWPRQFARAYLYETEPNDQSQMVTAGFGSCGPHRAASVPPRLNLCSSGMLIIGALASILLPTFQRVLGDKPKEHEKILKAYLSCLLIGDVSALASAGMTGLSRDLTCTCPVYSLCRNVDLRSCRTFKVDSDRLGQLAGHSHAESGKVGRSGDGAE